MRTWLGLLIAFLCCSTAAADDAVAELSKSLGKTPALVAVLCQGDGEEDLATITRLIEQTPWTLYCQGVSTTGLQKIRQWASEKNVLGSRVCVVNDAETSLRLAGNMADAIWLCPDAGVPPPEEVLRVLRPGGICLAGENTIVKPRPTNVDEWRHPYHGPDNNVTSQDRVARLPGELRFQTQPVFAAMPNQTLLAGGRMFFFSGHIAFHEREEPTLNRLTVLNAYNGLRLWSYPLDPNYVVHNVAKLATDREVVFAEGKTLRMLAADTGQERGKFSVPAEAAAAGDTDWKWLAQEKGVLWAAMGPPDARVAPHQGRRLMGHWPWDVADAQYKGIVENFGAARRLAAFQFPR